MFPLGNPLSFQTLSSKSLRIRRVGFWASCIISQILRKENVEEMVNYTGSQFFYSNPQVLQFHVKHSRPPQFAISPAFWFVIRSLDPSLPHLVAVLFSFFSSAFCLRFPFRFLHDSIRFDHFNPVLLGPFWFTGSLDLHVIGCRFSGFSSIHFPPSFHFSTSRFPTNFHLILTLNFPIFALISTLFSL